MVEEKYVALESLSTKVLLWQLEAREDLPHDIWEEGYHLLQTKGRGTLGRQYTTVDMDDPIQDVAVEMPRIARGYSARGAEFSTYLIQALRHSVFDLLRRRKPSPTMSERLQEYVAELSRMKACDPVEQAQYNETLARTNAAMATLPEEERSLFCLSLSKMSYREIGTLFGLTTDGVKCRVYRAREKYKAALERNNPPTSINYLEPILTQSKSTEPKPMSKKTPDRTIDDVLSPALQNAINGLPAPQRIVIEMVLQEKVTIEEVATRLSIGLDRAKSTYKRARENVFRKVGIVDALALVTAA